jgi:hypothetical protein
MGWTFSSFGFCNERTSSLTGLDHRHQHKGFLATISKPVCVYYDDYGETPASRLGRFNPRERAYGIHCVGCWWTPEPVWRQRWRIKKADPAVVRTPAVHLAASWLSYTAVRIMDRYSLNGADPSGRAVWGVGLDRCDRGFESCVRHGWLSSSFCVVSR